MTGAREESRLRRALSVAGVIASYASGLGTVVLALVIFGVRPDNFGRWLISPLGLILIGAIVLTALWQFRKHRR